MADEFKDPIEKRSMSKWLFVLGSLFFVISFYAMIDEGIVRRTYKFFQHEFNKYETSLIQKEYDELKAKIETCLTDTAIQAKMAATSAHMRQFNGPEKAAGLLDQLIKEHS